MGANFDSLDHLARSCGERAWRTARALCGNAADADDAVQEAFVVAARKREAIPADDPWPWFAQVLLFETRRMRRRRVSAQARESVMRLPHEQTPADDRLAREELARAAFEALAELPEDEREVLTLTQMSGLGVRDAAAALGISKSALDRRVQSGLQRMRARLRCAEGALLGCLPLVPIELPPKGYAVSAERWLSRAKAASLAEPATWGGTSMFKAVGAVVSVAAILVLIGIWHPWQRDNATNTIADLGNGEVALRADAVSRKSEKPVAETPARDGAGSAVASKAAKADEKSPTRALPVEATPTFAIKGMCREFVPHDNYQYSLSDKPVAGATVWLMRAKPGNRGYVAFKQGEENYEMENDYDGVIEENDAALFKTTSAADGSWSFKDIPAFWPAESGKDPQRVEQLQIVAYHPVSWGWDKCPRWLDEDDQWWNYRRGWLAKRGNEPLSRDHARRSSVRVTVKGDANKPELECLANVREWIASWSRDGEPPIALVDGAVCLGFAPPVRLHGTVFDTAGKPVQGAKVQLEDCRDAQTRGSLDRVDEVLREGGNEVDGRFVAQIVTDASGRYQFEGAHPWMPTLVVASKEPNLKARAEPRLEGPGEFNQDLMLRVPSTIRAQYIPDPERTSFKGLYLRVESDTTFVRGIKTVRVPDSRCVDFDGLEYGRRYRLRLIVFDDWLDAEEEAQLSDPDFADGPTRVFTNFVALESSLLAIDVAEPGNITVRVKLPPEVFSDNVQKVVVALAPTDWFDYTAGAGALLQLLTAKAGDNVRYWGDAPPRKEALVGEQVIELKSHASNIGERSLRAVAFPVELAERLDELRGKSCTGPDGDKWRELLARLFFSEAFILIAAGEQEIALGAASFWTACRPAIVRGKIDGGGEFQLTLTRNLDTATVERFRGFYWAGRAVISRSNSNSEFEFVEFVLPGEYRWQFAVLDENEYWSYIEDTQAPTGLPLVLTIKPGETLNLELQAPAPDAKPPDEGK
ncbi:MAG: sigma-70 family RNA polymerase sigma factor [Planctomycetes bacterium]|nr:sigma-70 family RNA polymerase sigma factor [Planctomycetota bacterium]